MREDDLEERMQTDFPSVRCLLSGLPQDTVSFALAKQRVTAIDSRADSDSKISA